MTEIPVLDPEFESGVWPEEFNGGWIEIVDDTISGDTVAVLYFNENNPSGTVTVLNARIFREDIPDAYISWAPNGRCREIFVHPNYRRRGIGTKLCAFARSWAYHNQGVVFDSPGSMSHSAKKMYEYVCESYGEEFKEPLPFPEGVPYPYWGGYLI